MKRNGVFFSLAIIATLSVVAGFDAIAAPRTAIRGTASVARKPVSTTQKTDKVPTQTETIVETPTKPETVVVNKSDTFAGVDSGLSDSSDSDTAFAEQIRRQRAALSASESQDAARQKMKNDTNRASNDCDNALRQCMIKTCGDEDFSKCATDGDTIFGDKLNACRKNTTCSTHEFNLFAPEIRADRDMAIKLSSYNSVKNCGNNYMKCIVGECGATFTKCLGKTNADNAIKKCETIAKNCRESDSGLASRFSNAIGKLRENAEIGIKSDEERLYALRDLMRAQCEHLGAMFDERSFNCVYTVNFFAGNNQSEPLASRKAYAGDSFTCAQEWFGINATTFKENAYRETRAQTAASSAMLGSGVGTAVGLATSGAIGRSLETQKAKKELKAEQKAQNETDDKGIQDTEPAATPETPATAQVGATMDNKDNKTTTTTPTDNSAFILNKGSKFEVDMRTPQQKKQDADNKKMQDAVFGNNSTKVGGDFKPQHIPGSGFTPDPTIKSPAQFSKDLNKSLNSGITSRGTGFSSSSTSTTASSSSSGGATSGSSTTSASK